VKIRLQKEGWSVLRFWEHQVFADAPGCAERTLSTLQRLTIASK